jgi:Bacterial Ig domain
MEPRGRACAMVEPMFLRPAALALALSSAAPAIPPVGRTELLQAAQHDVSPPLWLLRPVGPGRSREEREPRPVPLPAWPAPERDPVLQESMPFVLVPQAGSSFDGIGQGIVGVPPAQAFQVIGIPPDPQGDVGPAHYLQMVNASFAVFSKQGTLLFGPVPTRTLFSGFGGACETNDDGDGIVLYDPLADRWLVSQFAISDPTAGPFLECVAVSRTPDPTGAYARYAFSYAMFNDYPKLAVWPDAYYATYNLFPNSNTDRFQGVQLCAFDRARMLAGEAAAQQCVRIAPDQVSGMTPADLDGPFPPPPGEPGFALGFGQNSLFLFVFHVDWTDADNSAVDSIELPVAPFTPACASTRTGSCIPQLSTDAYGLDALSDRMMFRVAYRNLGGVESLVANHTVTAGDSSGVRWYEVRDPAGDPFVYQQGTYAPDAHWRWMGSAAMDRAGNIGLGFSISGPDMNPGITYTGRSVSDPPGTMALGEAASFIGGGSQIGSQRWGDYSNLSVDPADDCTFWYTAEYVPADGVLNWHTRIATFQLPGCAPAPADFAVWLSPGQQTLARGRAATYTISTAALRPTAAGTSLGLSLVPPLPSGIAGSIVPASVAPGQVATLTLLAAADAPAGEVRFAVQAVEGPTIQTGSATTVVIANDFAAALDKPAALIGAGGTATFQVATSVVAGTAETITFSAARLPAGVTATFEPPSVAAGGSSALRLSGSESLQAGQTNMRVTAASPSASHRLTARVRAIAAPFAQITWPTRLTNLRGTAPIVATAAASHGTVLASLELYVDDAKVRTVTSPGSPAVLDWDTRRVDDGPHVLSVRATDAIGTQGNSLGVEVWVDNKGVCGCSSDAGGWEALGFLGLLAALRPSRRSASIRGGRQASLRPAPDPAPMPRRCALTCRTRTAP